MAERDHHGAVLQFKLLGIPIEIRPTFLLVAALLGLSANRVDLIFAWVGVIFISILIHELGHAFTARWFGSDVAIELNGIGGLTSWTMPQGGITPARRALVAAAGSATGLLFGGLIWLIALPFGPFTQVPGFVISNLVFVNVFWGLLNWLPIRPLDGGHLLTSLLERFAPARGERIANVVFFITAALALASAFYFRLIFVGLISGWLLWGELTRGRPRRQPVGIPVMDFDAPLSEAGPEENSDPSQTRH